MGEVNVHLSKTKILRGDHFELLEAISSLPDPLHAFLNTNQHNFAAQPEQEYYTPDFERTLELASSNPSLEIRET